MDPLTQTFITSIGSKSIEQAVEWLWNEAKNISSKWINKKNADRKKNLKIESSLPSFVKGKLKREIQEELAELYKDEIKALIKQIEIHHRNLQHYKLQETKMGMFTPPLVLNGIQDELESLGGKGAKLKKIIELIYGEKISFNFN